MAELNRYWTAGPIRNHLCIRAWARNPLRGFWRWLWTGGWWDDRPELDLRTHHDQDQCYCPFGLRTNFRVQLFGVGLWGWWSRDWTRRPCWCSCVVWVLFPDEDSLDEIEAAGGYEHLCRRFPGLEKVNPAFPTHERTS